MWPRNIRVPAKWLVFPVVGLAFVSAPLPAQRYEFRNYGQEDGLTNLVVSSIAQDRQGFLWVGTQNGLFWYDGERFQGFFQSQGLPDSNVWSVHESGDGTLWVGTSTGLARWIGDRFEAVQVGQPFQITGRHAISSRGDGWYTPGRAKVCWWGGEGRMGADTPGNSIRWGLSLERSARLTGIRAPENFGSGRVAACLNFTMAESSAGAPMRAFRPTSGASCWPTGMETCGSAA